MNLQKCDKCGGVTTEGLIICPACMKAAGAAPADVAAAEELTDIARVLSITADTDTNIKEAMQGVLNIAERLRKEE